MIATFSCRFIQFDFNSLLVGDYILHLALTNCIGRSIVPLPIGTTWRRRGVALHLWGRKIHCRRLYGGTVSEVRHGGQWKLFFHNSNIDQSEESIGSWPLSCWEWRWKSRKLTFDGVRIQFVPFHGRLSVPDIRISVSGIGWNVWVSGMPSKSRENCFDGKVLTLSWSKKIFCRKKCYS